MRPSEVIYIDAQHPNSAHLPPLCVGTFSLNSANETIASLKEQGFTIENVEIKCLNAEANSL